MSEIGNGIDAGRWMNFGGDVPEKFDDHVKQSIPGYDRVMEKIGFISQFFILDDSNYLDIGSSTGRTIFEVVNNNYGKKFCVDSVDETPEMVAFLKDKWLEAKPWVHEFNAWCVDVTQFFPMKKYDLVVASLVLQFTRKEVRPMIIKAIHDSLNVGGAFLWYEKCAESSPTAADISKQYLNAFKRKSGLPADAVLNKDDSLRGIMPLRAYEDNYRMLVESGFSEISVMDKDGGFTLFVSIK